MAVLMDNAGKRIKGDEVTQEGWDAAMGSLGAMELIVLEAATSRGSIVDSRLGLLSDRALEILRTRYTDREQSVISGPGDSSDESVRSVFASSARRIPSSLLKSTSEAGFTYKQWRRTTLGEAVAIKAQDRVREMLDDEVDGVEGSSTVIWGRWLNRETQVIPISGSARIRSGYATFTTDMDGKVVIIAGGQECVVHSWSPDTQRFIALSHPISGTREGGACFVEFPNGVDVCSASGRWDERIDHPIFLWVMGCDLTRSGKSQSMRIVRIMQPMTGLRRITRQMPDGTLEVLVDTLSKDMDKPGQAAE